MSRRRTPTSSPTRRSRASRRRPGGDVVGQGVGARHRGGGLRRGRPRAARALSRAAAVGGISIGRGPDGRRGAPTATGSTPSTSGCPCSTSGLGRAGRGGRRRGRAHRRAAGRRPAARAGRARRRGRRRAAALRRRARGHLHLRRLARPLRARPGGAVPGRPGWSRPTRWCCSTCAGCPATTSWPGCTPAARSTRRPGPEADDEAAARHRPRRRRSGASGCSSCSTTEPDRPPVLRQASAPSGSAAVGRARARHADQQLAHVVVGEQAAVGGGVDQPEGRVGLGARRVESTAPGRPRRSWAAQRSTYSRWSARTCSRAASGSDSQSRSCTTIRERWCRAKSTCQSTSATRASAPSAASATRSRPTVEQLLADRDQHLGEHGVLGGEVLVERGAGDAAGRAEVGDRDAVEAARREELGGGREDLLAARLLHLGHAHSLVPGADLRRSGGSLDAGPAAPARRSRAPAGRPRAAAAPARQSRPITRHPT